MSKMTRNELKSIVKECLVEILSEGLVNSSERIAESNKPKQVIPQRPVSRVPDQSEVRRKMADNITVGQPRQQKPTAIPQVINRLTSDPMMAEIFADTARTTLLSQNQKNPNEVLRENSSDPAVSAMLSTDPMNAFDGAENWATLAFADRKAR